MATPTMATPTGWLVLPYTYWLDLLATPTGYTYWLDLPTRFLVQLGLISEITETLLLALGDFYAKMLASVVLMQAPG